MVLQALNGETIMKKHMICKEIPLNDKIVRRTKTDADQQVFAELSVVCTPTTHPLASQVFAELSAACTPLDPLKFTLPRIGGLRLKSQQIKQKSIHETQLLHKRDVCVHRSKSNPIKQEPIHEARDTKNTLPVRSGQRSCKNDVSSASTINDMTSQKSKLDLYDSGEEISEFTNTSESFWNIMGQRYKARTLSIKTDIFQIKRGILRQCQGGMKAVRGICYKGEVKVRW